MKMLNEMLESLDDNITKNEDILKIKKASR